jgi:hypothetical protein
MPAKLTPYNLPPEPLRPEFDPFISPELGFRPVIHRPPPGQQDFLYLYEPDLICLATVLKISFDLADFDWATVIRRGIVNHIDRIGFRFYAPERRKEYEFHSVGRIEMASASKFSLLPIEVNEVTL